MTDGTEVYLGADEGVVEVDNAFVDHIGDKPLDSLFFLLGVEVFPEQAGNMG